MRPRRWTRFAGIALFAVVACATGWWVYHDVIPRRFFTVEDVEADIALALPPGSNEADVVAFLEREGYDHGTDGMRRSSVNDGYLRAQHVPSGTWRIFAIKRDSSRDWLWTTDVFVYFVFDESRGFVRAYAYEESQDAP